MILMILLIILLNIADAASVSAGSIFYKRNEKTDCWSSDDLAKLRARKYLEDIIPGKIEPSKIDSNFVKSELRYFRRALRNIERQSDPHVAKLLKEVLSDTIGAHLQSEILPTIRFAFYAGYIPYRSARQLHNLYEEQKAFLNSQGLGWRKPKRSPEWPNLIVSKILLGSGTFFDYCSGLVLKRDLNSCIQLPTPKLDDNYEPTAIALPFKTGGLVSLTSPASNNILLKYYTTASRCILGKSPERCRHSDFVTFNNEMWHWMKRNVAPHLLDEKLYSAYGGVLRIAAAVQNYGKDLSRRNLYDDGEVELKKWNPWSIVSEPYIYIDTDWTPQLYILLVLLTAIAMYLVIICYTYLCGEDMSCRCRGASEPDLDYANVETDIPDDLPQSGIIYSDSKHSPSQTKRVSSNVIRTQTVYDLNENTEKLMDVVSDDASSSETSKIETKRPKSPPKIEPSTSLTIEKAPRADRSRPMYATMKRKASYRMESRGSSAWSGSETSSGSCSGSSTSSKSRKSRRSRDLAWARRVVSKSTLRQGSIASRTDLDVSSFTTRTRTP